MPLARSSSHWFGRIAPSVVGLLGLAGAACTAKVAPKPSVEVESDAEVESEVGAATSLEPALELTPAGPAADKFVPVVAIASTPATAPWRSVATPKEVLTLVDLSAGVLAKGARAYYQLDSNGQLARFKLEAPGAPILGVWPSNAWFIEQGDKRMEDERGDEVTRTQLRLMRLTEGKRWFPQEFRGELQFIDDRGYDFRVSNHSGLLVLESDQFMRVASTAEPPMRGAYEGSFLFDGLETASGEIYPISSSDRANVYAQIQCGESLCVEASSKQLPVLHGDWTFSHVIPRKQRSVTALVRISVYATNEILHFLLHYDGPDESPNFLFNHEETGGWELEELGVGLEPSGMWATNDGGMWTQTGDSLRHRDPDGIWHDIALPEGLSGLSVAITEDRSELWIAGLVGGSPVVFATPANAQAAPEGPQTPR